jgi:hypothetical protein
MTILEEIVNGVQTPAIENLLAAGGEVGVLNSGRSVVFDLEILFRSSALFSLDFFFSACACYSCYSCALMPPGFGRPAEAAVPHSSW